MASSSNCSEETLPHISEASVRNDENVRVITSSSVRKIEEVDKLLRVKGVDEFHWIIQSSRRQSDETKLDSSGIVSLSQIHEQLEQGSVYWVTAEEDSSRSFTESERIQQEAFVVPTRNLERPFFPGYQFVVWIYAGMEGSNQETSVGWSVYLRQQKRLGLSAA